MRFRFCGDADCPDWVLAEITTLSRVSSVKLKLLGRVVAQCMVQPPLEFEKAEKILLDSKLDPNLHLKSSIACISFILTSATRFNCDQGVLGNELQQLGLPREHSQAIRKIYVDHCEAINSLLKSQSLRVNKLDEITAHSVPQIEAVDAELKINNTVQEVRIPKHQLRPMLNDLKKLKAQMQELNSADHLF